MRDGCGTPMIVDECGAQPLRVDDPVLRLFNLYLAAAAPTLRDALLRVTRRMETLIEYVSNQPHRDDKLVMLAYGVIGDSRPPLKEQAAVQETARLGQSEIEFEATG